MNLKLLFKKAHTEYNANNRIERLYYLNRKKQLHGEYMGHYPNGSLKLTAHYVNGVLDGNYKEFYENGKPKSTSEYVGGKLNDIHTEYFDNGKLKATTEYRDGKRQGLYYEYFDNGKHYIKTMYVDDKRHGPYAEYYMTPHSLKILTVYAHNELNGLYAEYDTEKNIIANHIYQKGNKIPADANGQITAESLKKTAQRIKECELKIISHLNPNNKTA